MCRYCNYDLSLHYLINTTNLLEKSITESITNNDRVSNDIDTDIVRDNITYISNLAHSDRAAQSDTYRSFLTISNNASQNLTLVEEKLNTVIPDESEFPLRENDFIIDPVILNNGNNAPEFNDNNWDFDGSRERLYGQIAIVDRALGFTYPSSIFTDKDGDNLTYSATLVNGDALPSWLNIDTNTGTFTGTPSNSDLGILDIKLIATDPSGANASVNFYLDILNDIPVSNGNPGGVTNNLQLWLRGDAGIVATDGKVSAWLDQSSNNFYGSQSLDSYRPIINNNGLNGQPTLNFSADTLLNRGILGDHLDVAFNSKLNPDEFTIFIISSVDGRQGQWRSPLSSRGSNTGYNFYAGTNNNWQFWTGNGGGWNNISGNAPVTLNEWELVTGGYDGTNQSLLLDGKQIGSAARTYVPNTTAPLRLGGVGTNYYGSFPFEGDIAEVIIFDTALVEGDRNKVESYLAVKYGLSLDQTTATNYTASNNSIWWDASTAGNYQYNIAGIVNDAGSNLVQTKSSSSNLDGIVAVELENITQLTNGESLFWSDDGVSANINNISTDVPTSYDGRLARVWQVAETGEVGNVTLSFDLSGLGYSTTVVTEFALLLDNDTTFNDAIAYTTGRSIEDQTISFTNLDLDAGQYFTLATSNTVNKNPTGTDNLVSTDEDISYSFTAGDFGFNDEDAGDTLVKVLITSLPQHGTLKLNNVAVTENQSINLADIPNLTFTPDVDQFGEEYTNFEFKVNDGEAYSINANQITVTVNPVIDAAEISSSEASDVDDGTVIDVIIVYTQGALDLAGSFATFKKEIDEEIDLLNEALVRSGVSFTANVVHYRLIEDYVGVDNRTDLGRLANASDGYMDEIHDWRDEYSADIVSLITTGPGTGIAYFPGEYNAQSYGVRYNLDHEIGHNLGGGHDVYVGGNSTTAIAGYKSLEERVATVMSYGQGGTTWTQTFSSPDLIIRDVPFGSDEADNVGQMNSRAITSSNFRHSNDHLANAAEITESDFSIQALNKNAKKETNEPDIMDTVGGKSVWWTWTAPNNNAIEINTENSNFDTLLAVYTGTDYSNLQLVTEDNDTGINNTSKVAFTPTAGTTYQIVVEGESNSSGQIQLNSATLPTLPTVSITVTDNFAAEAGVNTGSFRIARNDTNGDLSVNLSFTGTKGTEDYILSINGTELTSSSITIPDGETFVDVLVTPIDDNATEIGGETLEVEIVSDFVNYLPANAPNNRGTITIADDDNASPGGLSTDNLQLWLDGNSQVDTDSNNVTTWRDRSSQGNDFTELFSGTNPSLNSNGLNFNPTIEFNDTSDRLGSSNITNFPTTEITQFLVLQRENPNRNEAYFSYANSQDNEFLLFNSGSETQTIINGTSRNVASSVDNNPTILGVDWQAGTGAGHLYNNGIGTEFTSSTSPITAAGTIVLGEEQDSQGGGFNSSQAFLGQIAENIIFDRVLTNQERQQVESYLAIKYGTTLDQTTPTNYVDSGSSIIWNATTAGEYNHDIAGIAKNNDSGLNQVQSKSSNDDGIVTISNASNLEDGEALVWGNNNNTPSHHLNTLTWQVQENNGDVGTVTVNFDLTQLGANFTNNAGLSDYALLIGNNDSFSNPTFHTTGKAIDNNTITFTEVDFTNGDYFTLYPRYNNPNIVTKGDSNSEEILGSNNPDLLNGDNGSDRIYGYTGDDILFGDELNDLLKGGDGNDDIHGGDGSDRLYGENDNDTLSGGKGQDILYGGTGNDFLDGGIEGDFLLGNGGNDIFVIAEGDAIYDYLDGSDKMAISNNLSFSDLAINQVGSHTEITIQTSDELLATLYNVDATTIDTNDFVLL